MEGLYLVQWAHIYRHPVTLLISLHLNWPSMTTCVETNQASCRILGTKCVTCLYIDNFAPFHNQMSVFHNIFVTFLYTIYFYKAESARKMDAPSKFSIYRMSHVIFGVEKLIFGQKSGKRYWTLIFYRKIIGL